MNPTNIISIDNNPPPCEAKTKFSKVAEKGRTTTGRSRKALTDLTNSVKPSSSKLVSKAGQKFNTGENIPTSLVPSLVEERFLHDHQKCIGAKIKAVDIDYFLEKVGLNNNGNENQLCWTIIIITIISFPASICHV